MLNFSNFLYESLQYVKLAGICSVRAGSSLDCLEKTLQNRLLVF